MTDKKQKKQKKTNEGSSRSCCPWFFGSLFLIGIIAGLIAYDTNVLHNGIFEESTVGRALKQTGALPHVENACFVSLKYSARGYKWLEENAPIAYSKSKTVLEPYGEFAKDLAATIINSSKKVWQCTRTYVSERTPIVIEFIDKYAPGLSEKASDVISNTFKGFCSICCSIWRNAVDFFKTKVFV
jgi:TMEM214, C-terminal, caspase 4 activator